MADRVVFLRPDAERIARAVRRVEGFRAEPPLTFSPALESRGRAAFRVCTFTGSWSINASKTVTFKNQTSTPNTVSALNLFFPITENAVNADCAIAKEGTAWYLIDVPFQTATISVAQVTASGFFASATTTAIVVNSTASISFVPASGTAAVSVVTDVSVSGSLDTSNCTISVSRTLTTQSITTVNLGATATAAVIASRSTAVLLSSPMTAVFATQTATAVVLQFRVT